MGRRRSEFAGCRNSGCCSGVGDAISGCCSGERDANSGSCSGERDANSGSCSGEKDANNGCCSGERDADTLRHFRVRMETEMRADWDGTVDAGYRGKARAVLMEASCGQV